MDLAELFDTSASQGTHIYSVAVGIVKDIKDPLDQGRIRVDFPWRAQETTHHSGQTSEESDSVDSTWARMVTPMAGGDRGNYFIPDVGDEVLLAFHHGDLERPYVIGALWNKSFKPPESMDKDGKNNLKTIKSRSGHQLTFNDNQEENKEKIVLKSKSGHQLTLDDESGKESLSLETKKGHKIKLDDSSGKEKIEVIDKAGSNSVVIDSNQNSITVKSNAKISIQSKMIDIKSSGMMNIEAGGVLTIKGSLVKIN